MLKIYYEHGRTRSKGPSHARNVDCLCLSFEVVLHLMHV